MKMLKPVAFCGLLTMVFFLAAREPLGDSVVMQIKTPWFGGAKWEFAVGLNQQTLRALGVVSGQPVLVSNGRGEDFGFLALEQNHAAPDVLWTSDRVKGLILKGMSEQPDGGQVRVSPLLWDTASTRTQSAVFRAVAALPEQGFEAGGAPWVGCGLREMRAMGVTPGAQARLKTPMGAATAVRVALLECGRGVLALSEPVQKKLALSPPAAAMLTLEPQMAHAGGEPLPSKVPWMDSLENALAASASDGRGVLALAYKPSCHGCELLRPILEDKEMLAWIVRTHPVQFNVLERRDLVDRYGIASTPTVLLLDAQGTQQARLWGLITPQRLTKFFQENLASEP